MISYTTCSDCGGTLATTWVGQSSHPGCRQTDEELKLRAFVDAAQRGDEDAANALERELNAPRPKPSLGGAALWYASVGWPVFPLLTPEQAQAKCRREQGLTMDKALKHPGTKNGLKDATTDESIIREWWTARPSAGIGIRTGVMFDIVDVDGPQGFESLASLDDGVIPEIHGKVSTPRGVHLYVSKTGDGNRTSVLPGIDYRGESGFCVAPPTEICGKAYSWILKPSPLILRTSVTA